MTQPVGSHGIVQWPDEDPPAPVAHPRPSTRAPVDLDASENALAVRGAGMSHPSRPECPRAAAVFATRAAGPGTSVCPNVVFDAAKGSYVLSESAQRSLQPLFNSFGFDVTRISIQFASPWQVGWKSAYTLGDSVTVNRDEWAGRTPHEQLGLLAHEITHSVQYARLGYAHFLARYAVQYVRPGNYDVPPKLTALPVRSLDPVDPRFTLDQIAERVSKACVEGR